MKKEKKWLSNNIDLKDKTPKEHYNKEFKKLVNGFQKNKNITSTL